SADTTAGGKGLFGVRPDKISLTHADDVGEIPEGRNRITGRIAGSSFIGVSTQFGAGSPVCTDFEVYVQNIDRDARLVPGAEVVLRGNPAHAVGPGAARGLAARVRPAGDEVP